jgi:hypothetical protein
MRGERLGGAGLLARVLGALALVYGTYNPEGVPVEQGVLAPRGVRGISHVALIIVSLVLAIGLSWSSMSRRLTGQMDTDEVG